MVDERRAIRAFHVKQFLSPHAKKAWRGWFVAAAPGWRQSLPRSAKDCGCSAQMCRLLAPSSMFLPILARHVLGAGLERGYPRASPLPARGERSLAEAERRRAGEGASPQ